MKQLALFALLILTGPLFAQDKTEKPVTLSADQQVTLLKSQKNVDALDKQLAELQQKYAEAQLFVKSGAQEQANSLFAKKSQAEKDVQDAKNKILTDLKLDPKTNEIAPDFTVHKLDKEKK